MRIPSGQTETFLARLDTLDLSSSMKAILEPLRSASEVLDDERAAADDRCEALVEADADVQRLTTLPGIGPITATAFVAALDTAARFERASQVTSYLGLVPSEYSSGEKQRRGRIARSAHPSVQSLLVQAAWRMARSKDPRTESFRTWAQAVAHRRGKKVAMVALARRLARTLFAMWRDQTEYQPTRIRRREPVAAATRVGTDVTASV